MARKKKEIKSEIYKPEGWPYTGDLIVNGVTVRFFYKNEKGESVNINQMPPEQLQRVRERAAEKLADGLMNPRGYYRKDDPNGRYVPVTPKQEKISTN